MLFNKKFKGIESFDPAKCEEERQKHPSFQKGEVPMGCCEGCWSGCIGGPQR